MTKKILIDTSHPEESRIALLAGDGSLEGFEREISQNRSLKGNIYLARAERIEPSLQAGFLDFGAEKDGFLAFNEIHPDYYRVPVEDRKALLEALSATSKSENEAEQSTPQPESTSEETLTFNATQDEAPDVATDNASKEHTKDTTKKIDEEPDTHAVRVQKNILKKYKIQEVVQKRQLMLVQVAKDARGSKGAALSTYLSLPGRYCVLMPNTPKGGGISRKITDITERKRLKSLVSGLDIPQGMGVILRTAAVKRTKAEIKKDYDYLMKTWETIREKTVSSSAPSMIYEEGSLITKTLRDLYTRDTEAVFVQGERGLDEARAFMKKLMPSHTKKIKLYDTPSPSLFQSYGIEEKIAQVHTPLCKLSSGGYLVFGTTEALTAIDVNSGRATRERDISTTALKTNLEAAEEIAKQLRLRDVGGLIVIDFIDMDTNKHNAQVERRLEKALSSDKARTQMGRISDFGLLEMSRQRLKPSVQEAMGAQCPHCKGLGVAPSLESSALLVLRTLENTLSKSPSSPLIVSVSKDVALYILNQKGDYLRQLQETHTTPFSFKIDTELVTSEYHVAEEKPQKTTQKPSSKTPRTKDKRTQQAPKPDTKASAEEKAETNTKSSAKTGPKLRLVAKPDNHHTDHNKEDMHETKAAKEASEGTEKKAAKKPEKQYKTTRNTRLKMQGNGRSFSNKKRAQARAPLHNPKRAELEKKASEAKKNNAAKVQGDAVHPVEERPPAPTKKVEGGKKSWWKRILS